MSYDYEISQIDGLILIAALITFTIYTIKTVNKQRTTENKSTDNESVEGSDTFTQYPSS